MNHINGTFQLQNLKVTSFQVFKLNINKKIYTFGKLGGFYYPTQTCQNSGHSSVQKQSKTPIIYKMLIVPSAVKVPGLGNGL